MLANVGSKHNLHKHMSCTHSKQKDILHSWQAKRCFAHIVKGKKRYSHNKQKDVLHS